MARGRRLKLVSFTPHCSLNQLGVVLAPVYLGKIKSITPMHVLSVTCSLAHLCVILYSENFGADCVCQRIEREGYRKKEKERDGKEQGIKCCLDP